MGGRSPNRECSEGGSAAYAQCAQMAAPNPLPEPQVFLLTTIYEGLKERGTWPPFQFVDTVLDRDGHDIDQVVDGLPPDLSNLTPGVRLQYLSGYAHSLPWAQLPMLRAEPPDEAGDRLVPTDINVPVFAGVLSGALSLYD